ncbi:hypothetical protein FSP39_014933 [Pinctada imbricata]|uniref:Uncharacterized protein n=1 Tax=Pinctada imbricata TaxID=66713 RepID=A0AA88XWT5_PINIB|nr:hypothetical protein FSP39_014933 [Pinctada imbricata]
MEQSVTRTSRSDIDKDQTVCPICLEQFKSPKFLSCLHTFCAECIKQLEENEEIICPLCRVRTLLDSGSVDELRHNYFIESLMHISNADVPTCETCNKSVRSEHYCYDCQQYLCPSCFDTHQALRMSRTHRSATVGSMEHSHMTLKSFCAQHRNEELRFICKQCDKSICRDCKVTCHEGHKTIDIEEYRKESKDTMTKALDEVDQLSEHLQNTKRVLENYEESFHEVNLTTSSNLATLRKCMHEKIDEKFDSVLRKLEEKEKKQLDAIKQKEQSFSANIHALAWRRNHIRSVLQFGTTVDLVETNRMMDELSVESKRNDNQQINLRLSLPSISPDAGEINVPIQVPLHFRDIEIQIPLKYQKVSTMFLVDVYPLWISKLQVTDANECYVSLQHQHKRARYMPFTFNLMRYKENGELAEFRKGPSMKDIVWCDGELVVLYEHSFDTTPPLKKDEEKGDSTKSTKKDVLQLFAHNCVCAFEHLNQRIFFLDIYGNLKDKEYKMVCKLTVFNSIPSSATCSKSGDILVCFPDNRCVIKYDLHGSVYETFDNSSYPVLSKTFQPRDITKDSRGFAYVVDYDNDSVFRIDIESGIVLSLIHNCQEIAGPIALAIDKKGRIWIGHGKDKITIFMLN